MEATLPHALWNLDVFFMTYLCRCFYGGTGGAKDARPLLPKCLRAILHCLLGTDEGLRQALEETMDYILAAVASVLLFGYLLCALLKPESF